MIGTRKTLVAANSQHRPEEAWLVMGDPSRGILMLKFCVSAMVIEREERTALAGLELRATRASRFCAWCKCTVGEIDFVYPPYHPSKAPLPTVKLPLPRYLAYMGQQGHSLYVLRPISVYPTSI